MHQRVVPDGSGPNRKRSANACSTCRARKVKCDGRLGGCLNCEKLLLTCAPSRSVRAVTPPSHVHEEDQVATEVAGSKRKRSYRSCLSCRTSKVKCSGERPCLRCRKRSASCEYDTDAEPAWMRSFAPSRSRLSDSAAAHSPETGSLSQHHHHHDTTIATSNTEPSLSPLTWLEEQTLPGKPKLHSLLEAYFDNVHPIRIFAFIHKPSFMRMLDEGEFTSSADEALLHIMAALGARFYALHYHETILPVPDDFMRNVGRQWARVSEQLLFAEYSNISTTRLKALVLLHDFEARIGRYAQSFVLTGMITRMAHALQINNERSADILGREQCLPLNEVTLRETNRRLMWSCYMIDVWAGSGVDQLTLLRQVDIRLQLPCTDRNFMLQIPSITERLEPGQHLEFLRSRDTMNDPSENLGISAYYVRIVSIWQRILRFIKHLDEAEVPWIEKSEFTSLNHQLEQWFESLPSWLRFSPENIYLRKESNQLGALFLIHCMYHHAICDLNRIALPELFMAQEPFSFPPEQREFVARLQEVCFFEAQNVATHIATTLKHGARHLSDPILPSFAYNSSRIMLYYIARILDLSSPDSSAIIKRIIDLVSSNNEALVAMSIMYPLAEPLYITIDRWLDKVRDTLACGRPTSYIGPQDPSNLNEEAQEEFQRPSPSSTIESIPDQQLNPLSMFRLTRKTLQNQSEVLAQTQYRPKVRLSTTENNHYSQAGAAVSHGDASSHNVPGTDTDNQLMDPTAAPMQYSEGTITANSPLLDLDNFQNFFEWDFAQPMSGLGAFESTDTSGWMSGGGNL